MVSTSLKNMKVSWDDNSQYMEKMKLMFQTTNQITVALLVIKSPTEAPQRTAKARAEHGVGSPRTSAFSEKNLRLISLNILVDMFSHTTLLVFTMAFTILIHTGCVISLVVVYCLAYCLYTGWLLIQIYTPHLFLLDGHIRFFFGSGTQIPWNEGRIHTGKAGFYRLGLPRKLYHRQNMAKTWGFSSQHGTQNHHS